MTNATSDVIVKFLTTHSFAYLSVTLCLVAVVLLILLIAEQQLLTAGDPEKSRTNFAIFAVVIVPLFFLFLGIITTRFVHLS